MEMTTIQTKTVVPVKRAIEKLEAQVLEVVNIRNHHHVAISKVSCIIT